MLYRVWTHVVAACLKCGTTGRISIKFGMGVMLTVVSLQGNTSLLKGTKKWAFGIAEPFCFCALREFIFRGNRPILTKFGMTVRHFRTPKHRRFSFATVTNNKTADE